ncbi:hypothetical protein DOTSEDRAFT_70592 [Dothistroma septosporum NZE10]|uniref:Phosphatidate cytidylyltransferase-like protein n=1 Tax=Dothistroma septosporum (strain NZE10 / CBS 128990) TaxID=675120 RepID=N1PWQ6_DOTSN|nr:hypothetical protein DOTSEDRAFT_70592 [Dothistroma septosporum NZE10]
MSQYQVPNTPRVVSPSPTPSEQSGKDGYFAHTTRCQVQRKSSIDPIQEHAVDHEEDPDLARARSRSRSPHLGRRATRDLRMTMNGHVSSSGTATASKSDSTTKPTRRKTDDLKVTNGAPKDGDTNGFLSPAAAYPEGFGSAYWRNLSRSPSPLGLIPIHREWRAFVHRHEVPRKLLHVSIGFMTLWLYSAGAQKDQIHPVLLGILIPILSADLIRFRWPKFNRFYIRVLGPFMRESEAHDQFNGVISYVAGLWAAMYFCKKDVAVMSVLLLSWCDTAASTFGRLWGKYTPRVRRGKSLAGSMAAFTFGVGSAVLFWAFVAPHTPKELNMGVNSFAFDGTLTMPLYLRDSFGLTKEQASVDGSAALGLVSLASGVVASASEAIDLWGLDDNLTIPILCGIGLGAFLWVFGGS